MTGSGNAYRFNRHCQIIVSFLLDFVGGITRTKGSAIADVTGSSNEWLLDRYKKTGACEGSGFQ
jgi:hypothetical protein